MKVYAKHKEEIPHGEKTDDSRDYRGASGRYRQRPAAAGCASASGTSTIPNARSGQSSRANADGTTWRFRGQRRQTLRAPRNHAVLLRSYFARHRRMPSIGGLPAHDMAGTVPSEEDINNLTWSGLHAMVPENKPNIPESYGVYVISAGVPVNRSDWNPPQRGAVRGACPFATRHSPCRQGRGDGGDAARGHSSVSIPRPTFFDRDASPGATRPASERKRPVIDLTNDEDHDWLHHVRRERRIREFVTSESQLQRNSQNGYRSGERRTSGAWRIFWNSIRVNRLVDSAYVVPTLGINEVLLRVPYLCRAARDVGRGSREYD